MNNEEDKIELKSEELQDILGAVPPWILRWGITIIAIIAIMLLIGSAIFKYPDVIGAQITLTGMTPPANIVAKSSGKLKELLISDNQMVSKDEWLAVIDNPVCTNDLLYLKRYTDTLDTEKRITLPRKGLKLGSLQSLYSVLYSSLYDFNEFKRQNYYPLKIQLTKERINKQELQFDDMIRQAKIAEKQLALSRKQFERDSTLHNGGVTSQQEYETANSQFLQACMSFENISTSMKNMRIQIDQMEESLFDIEQQYTDKKNTFATQLLNHINQIKTEILVWEMNYVLISPIKGKVSFTKYWTQNQNISGGEEVFTVVPTEEPRLIGKAVLPIARSGKVKVGQKVNIRFDNFPDSEFGLIKGTVKNISLIPTQVDQNYAYTVEVDFPQKLLTTYGKTLPYLPHMKGQADIVTDDITLLERFIMPLRKIISQGLN